jgi:hypothetical protein
MWDLSHVQQDCRPPFSIDAKPRHGSPDAAHDIAFEKISAQVTATKMASERLGL